MAKSARGGMVLSVGVVSEQGLRFVLRMILTRLLAAEHLGLMAIIMVVSLGCEAFTEVGVKQSVIQNKKGSRPEYLNVAWLFQAIRGILLYGAAFLLAPVIWRFYFYDKPELTVLYDQSEILMLLRVAFLTILFNGLMSPRVHVLQKEFRFGRLVLLIQGSSVLGALSTIALVFYIRNVWALVIGFVLEGVVRTLLSFILCPFRPRLSIHRESLREIARFARGMFGLPILVFIASQTHIIVLGKIMSMSLVGMYVMAIRLSNIPHKLFTKTISLVLLPAFAEKQDYEKALCSATLKLSRAATAIGVAIAGFMAIYSTAVLSVVYGQEYAAVALPFSLLCAYALVSIHERIFGSLYLAIGLPHLHRRISAVRAILIVGLIYPGTALFGLAGAAGVMLVANTVTLCTQVVLMRKAIGLKFRQYVCSWLPGLWVIIILLVPRGALKFLGVESIVLNFIAGGLSCSVGCIIGLLLLKSSRRKPLSNNLRQIELSCNGTSTIA